MYLKSLSIRGFKSFADKTTLKFEPGITVIVGPNGSGKSNISDAILWVLGEQSPRSLRGAAMEDVIFTGSSTRPLLGIAEVSLTLDNTDKQLPIEFSEVTITRRMSRSGESDYFINGSICRLLDVQDLLSDSGLGRQTYCIVSQGKIEEILNSKPEEKRLLIEEVAGVLKHRKRKERAIRKLQAMDQNLLRIRDVLREVERQLRPLQKQASEAEKFLKLSHQLKDLNIALAATELKKFQDDWKSVANEDNCLNNELTALRKRLKDKKEEINKIQLDLEEKGDYVGDIGEYRHRLKGIIERLNTGLLLLEEKGKHLIEKMSDIRGQIYQDERHKNNKSKELDEVISRISEIKKDIDDVSGKIIQIKKSNEIWQKNTEQTDKKLIDFKKKNGEKNKQLESNEKEIKVLSDSLNASKMEDKFVIEKVAVLENEKNTLFKSLEKKEKEKVSIESKLTELNNFLHETENRASNCLVNLNDLESQLKEREGDIYKIKTKISALEEVEKKLIGYPESVTWLILEKETSGLNGIVGDLLDIDKRYEKAIESALSENMYGVIANDISVAKDVINVLNQSEQDIVSIIPLKGFKRAPVSLTGDFKAISAMDVVKYPKKIESAVQAILGNVFIVDNLDIAIDAVEKYSNNSLFVTLSGEVVSPKGIIKGGNPPRTTPLYRKRILAELKKDEKTLANSLTKMKKKIQQSQLDLELAVNEKGNLIEEVRLVKDKRQNMVSDLLYLKELITKKTKEMEDLLFQNEQAKKKISFDMKKIEVLKDKNKLLKKEIAVIESSIKKAEADKQKYFVEKNKLSNEHARFRTEKESFLEQLTFIEKQCKVIVDDINEFNQTLESKNKTVKIMENLRERIQPLHELFVTLFNEAKKWDKKLESLVLDEKMDTKKLREKYKLLQTEVIPLSNEIDITQNRIKEIEVECAELKLKITGSTDKIVNEYNISLKKALKACRENLNKKECKEKIEKIEAKLASLGPTNQIAVREYSALEDRHKFLKDQISDLKKSGKALERVVKIIEQKMKDRFLETFNEVNDSFQNIFSYLFSGGRARLLLTDEENHLTTGVEIEVHPMGKHLQRMTLLSGGEKSLVALTLLFAIYHTKPSPFYLLDEVEPALDDVNLQRFIALLDKEKSDTQFLIITHQRRTMEVADCLYGVTMQADGVSKLVSQKMNDFERENKVS